MKDKEITIIVHRPEGTVWNEEAAAEFRKIIEDRRLSHAAFCFLCVLHSEMDKGNTNITMDYFAKLQNKNRSTIYRWLNQILKAGYAKRTGRGVYEFEFFPAKFV